MGFVMLDAVMPGCVLTAVGGCAPAGSLATPFHHCAWWVVYLLRQLAPKVSEEKLNSSLSRHRSAISV